MTTQEQMDNELKKYNKSVKTGFVYVMLFIVAMAALGAACFYYIFKSIL